MRTSICRPAVWPTSCEPSSTGASEARPGWRTDCWPRWPRPTRRPPRLTMCGICGHTDDAALRRVQRMNAAMRLRGPDDDGEYVDAETGVALGARRLSIIDLEGGHQPVSNEDGTVWAALNGEIYNHPELQERLRARGHRLGSGVDTEVLVHLYEDSGP